MRLVGLCMAAALAMYADAPSDDSGAKLYAGVCSGCHGQSGEGGRGPKLSDGAILRRLDDQQLFASIKNGLPGTDMPAFPALKDDQVRAIAAHLRTMTESAFNAKLPGSFAAGEAVYAKAQCANCHSIRGKGGVMGPDLSNIGRARSVKALQEAILDPSVRPTPGFDYATLVFSDGRKLEGVVKNYSNYVVSLLDSKGVLHSVDRAKVKSLDFKKGSLMPGDYGKRLTKAEIQDLIAFLGRQSLRGEESK